MNCESTVEQIVDRILALECGDRYEVKLDPRITRVDNLKWLLPICLQQFGTRIDILEHTEGDGVVLSIMVTAGGRKPAARETEQAIKVAAT